MKNKRDILIVVGVILFCFLVVGITYAYYKNVLFKDLSVGTITEGLDYYITYEKGNDLTSGTLDPGEEYTSGKSVSVEFWKKDDTYDHIYGQIYLEVTKIGSNLKNEKALKYKLVSDKDDEVIEGSLSDLTGDYEKGLLIGKNIDLNNTKTTYTIYIWLDDTMDINTDVSEEELDISVRCEATMVELQ